jgi:CubicO group peptidase (beta-lactamase class C family)
MTGTCVLRRSLAFLAVAASVAFAASAPAQDLPVADPASLGFSPARLAVLTRGIEGEIKEGRVPGAVVLITRRGKVAYFEAFGLQDKASNTPMRKDSIFRIYSMTKPVVSVAVMQLWEEGRFDLNDPIAKFLPEFKDLKVATVRKDPEGKSTVELVPARTQPTIQQLLTHTGGLSYDILPKSAELPVRQMYLDAGVASRDQTVAEMTEKIARLPLGSEPGTMWEYSRSTDVLGRLVEVISGLLLDRLLKARIFDPLGMKDTAFYVPAEKLDRLAEPAAGGPSVIDVKAPPKLLSGNAGLVSTAEDYLKFTEVLLNGGRYGGTRILGPKTVRYMTSDQIGTVRGPLYLPGPGYSFGLGFAVRLVAGQAASPGSVGDFSWGGLAGTIFWGDPAEQLAVVYMVQAVGTFFHNGWLLRTLVYQAMEE